MRELDYQCLLWPQAVCGSHRMPLRGPMGGVSVLDLDVTLNHVVHLMQIGSEGPKIWVPEDLLYSPKHVIFGALLPPPMESPLPRSRTFGSFVSDIHRVSLGLAALLLACVHGLVSQQQSTLRATRQQLFTAHFRQDMMAACPRFTWHVLIVLWVLLTTAFVATAVVTTRQALATGARRARRLHSDVRTRGCTVLEGGKSDMDMGRALAYAPPESARQIYPHLYGKTPRGWISDRLRRPSTGKVNTLTAIHEAKLAAGGRKFGRSLGSPQWTLLCDVLVHSDARHAVFLSLFLLMMTVELLPVTVGTYYPVASELLALVPFTSLLVPVGVMLLTTPVPWTRLYDRLIEILVPLRTGVTWLGDHPSGDTAATTSGHVTRPRKVVVGFEGLGLEMTGDCVAPPDRGIVLDTASGALKLANEAEDDEFLFLASRDSTFQEADNVARKRLLVLGTGLSDALRFSCSRSCRLPRGGVLKFVTQITSGLLSSSGFDTSYAVPVSVGDCPLTCQCSCPHLHISQDAPLGCA
ncbi:MAG: hypothetical protein KVP17_003065 [Porospora cf. gigantea B]|uniref:uncharacterized protein n=1 Tax=Porospora cf. gigantea B TaxID=2853592 RepID=UPI003571DB87|nr:MAG: hypothetical protein KVP17_003065 [Porospora cf. gigantea B]